jgi:hypothetical protein
VDILPAVSGSVRGSSTKLKDLACRVHHAPMRHALHALRVLTARKQCWNSRSQLIHTSIIDASTVQDVIEAIGIRSAEQFAKNKR